MCASWRRGFDPGPLIRRLEDVKQVGSRNGQVTFEGYRLSHVAAALHSCLCFDVGMPEREERGVIAEAVSSVGRVDKLTAPKVLRAITEREACFSARSEEPYILVTSVSARHFEGIGAEELGGATFAFDRFVPEPFGSQHEEARRNSEQHVLGRLPRPGITMRSYTGVRVSVSGKSQEEAKERALDSLDLLRGMWNLGINRNIGDRTSVGMRTSNNKVSLGPVHSLHHPDGQLVGRPWLETDYAGPVISYRMGCDWGYVKEYEKWVREELGRIPYRRDLEEVTRSYARALDRRDWDTSFVRLWAVLETLTYTGRVPYEMTEKRTLSSQGEGHTLPSPDSQVPYPLSQQDRPRWPRDPRDTDAALPTQVLRRAAPRIPPLGRSRLRQL